MGALNCANPGIAATESTEVFTVNKTSTSSLNVTTRDVESQQSKSSGSTRRHSIWWNLAFDLPLFCIVAILLGLYELGVIPSYKAGFFCNDPALSFPYLGDTVSGGLLIGTVLLWPVITIFVSELLLTDPIYPLRARTLQTLKISLLLYRSYFYGFFLNLVAIEVMKGITGSPRPTFFDICEPDTAKTCNGSEYVSSFECTSTKYSSWLQMDSYHSFPSGHTSFSVYCGFYVAWYLQRRAFDWQRRMVFLVPALQLLSGTFAAVSSLTRITDHRHHWWDVLTGVAIGVLTVYYAVVVLAKNFTITSSKSLGDMSSEENRHSTRTIV